MKLPRPKTVRFSYSRVSTFSDICELRYALDCLMPRTPPSSQQLQGTHLHDLLERLLKRCIAGETWEQVLAEPRIEEVPGALKPARLQCYLDKVAPWLTSTAPQHSELWFDAIRHPTTGELLEVAGKIDLVCTNTPGLKEGDTDAPSIWDFKTTGRAENVKQDWQIKRALQVATYALALGIPRVGYAYLWPGRAPDIAYVDLTTEHLIRVWEWYRHETETIETRWEHGGWAYASVEHTLCSKKWCPHWAACQGGGDLSKYVGGEK